MKEQSQLRNYINLFENNIYEDEESYDTNPADEKLAAISTLLLDKTDEEDSESRVDTEAFINIIQKMGIPMSMETLMDMSENGQLDSIIKTVSADEVVFNGQETAMSNSEMGVDKAHDVVNAMAKKGAKANMESKNNV